MSVFDGFSMRQGYFPLNKSEQFAQDQRGAIQKYLFADAVDAIDFANGDPAKSHWAQMRATII